jgi:pyruvate dehydrogenase (quinone)
MPNAADILIDTLIEWDVKVIFGLPGDGINGIMEALRKRQDQIRFIQVRHEESAAFMASAYAKFTGNLGVCVATSGPGGTHLLTGLYDAKLDQMEADRSSPLKPQAVVRAFDRHVAGDGVLVADSGQNTELAARHIDLGTRNQFTVSGALASMASGLPYAIAAGVADPERPIYAVIGDGGFSMQLGEFSTAVRMALPLKLLVICNGMLNQIAWEQMMFLGNPQFACELAPIDFAKVAEAMGGRGFTIRHFDQIEPTLTEAFSVAGPVVIQAFVDQYEPMMPPKMPKDYAKNFRAAFADTPGHEAIEENVSRSPLREMMAAGEGEKEISENTTELLGIP